MPTPFLPATFLPRGYLPAELAGDAAGLPPILDQDLVDYLGGALGVEPSPDELPTRASSLPLLSFTQVDGGSYSTLAGPTNAAWALMQFDIWDTQYARARRLRESLRLALEGYSGPMGASEIMNITLERPAGGYAPSAGGTEFGFHRQIAEFRIWYRQRVPNR